jgi:hypothetical protein
VARGILHIYIIKAAGKGNTETGLKFAIQMNNSRYILKAQKAD